MKFMLILISVLLFTINSYSAEIETFVTLSNNPDAGCVLITYLDYRLSEDEPNTYSLVKLYAEGWRLVQVISIPSYRSNLYVYYMERIGK